MNGKFSQTGAQHIATARGKHQLRGDPEQSTLLLQKE